MPYFQVQTSAKIRLFSYLFRAGESSRAFEQALDRSGEWIFLRNLRTKPNGTEWDFSGKQTPWGLVGLSPSPSTDRNRGFLPAPRLRAIRSSRVRSLSPSQSLNVRWSMQYA
jgi:hypothetical protein